MKTQSWQFSTFRPNDAKTQHLTDEAIQNEAASQPVLDDAPLSPPDSRPKAVPLSNVVCHGRAGLRILLSFRPRGNGSPSSDYSASRNFTPGSLRPIRLLGPKQHLLKVCPSGPGLSCLCLIVTGDRLCFSVFGLLGLLGVCSLLVFSAPGSGFRSCKGCPRRSLSSSPSSRPQAVALRSCERLPPPAFVVLSSFFSTPGSGSPIL